MLRNEKGQAALWEVVLLMFFVAGLFAYMDFKKQTETNTIQSGAKQDNVVNKKFALVNDISLFNWHSSKSTGSAAPAVSAVSVAEEKPVVESPTPIVVEPVSFDLAKTLGVPKETLASIGHLSPFERFGLDVVVILVVLVVGGLLDAIGGDFFLAARRYIMPSLVCVGVSVVYYTFNPVWYAWFLGLLVLPVCGTLTLPYKGDGNFGRGLWLFINSVTMGMFLVLVGYFLHAHFLAWYLYLTYVIVTGVLGGLYRNWAQFLGDWITGSWLCSVLFFVYLSLQFSL